MSCRMRLAFRYQWIIMQKVLLCLSLQWWHSVAIELNGVVIDGYGVYFLTVVVAVLRWYEELFKVVETAIVDVEVDISFYSRQSGRIGVLPELPLPAILHLVDVVVGNPIGVAVKSLVGQIGILEFRIGIDYRLYVVFVLDDVEPCEHIELEVLDALVLRFPLNVEHRWQVAWLQIGMGDEEISLLAGRRSETEIVVSTTNESVFLCEVEVLLEVLVEMLVTLRSLYDYESHR